MSEVSEKIKSLGQRATSRVACRIVASACNCDLETVQRIATGDTVGIDPEQIQKIVEALMVLIEAVQAMFADCPVNASASRIAAALKDRGNLLIRTTGRLGIRRTGRDYGCEPAVAAKLARVAIDKAPDDPDLEAALTELADPNAILL